MRPFEEPINRMDDIYGMGRRSSKEVLAEIGLDVSRSPRLPICHNEPACVGEITRAQASARADVPVVKINDYDQFLCRYPGPQRALRMHYIIIFNVGNVRSSLPMQKLISSC
jgi:hypothetical protein